MRYQEHDSSFIQGDNNTSNEHISRIKLQENEVLPISSSSWKESVVQYWCSMYLRTELFGCLLFFFVSPMVAEKILRIKLNERPIPYQQLNNGNDIVLDLGLNHEFIDFGDQTVPGWLLFVSTTIVPIILILGIGFQYGPKHDVHSGLCVYLVGMGLNVIITQSLKLYVGRFRPNFYNMCEFNIESLECEGGEALNKQGRMSFPSGHSSVTFCAITIITLFFLGKTHLFHISTLNSNKMKTKRIWSIVAVIPLSYAFFVAASRVRDNYHHPADVVAGSLIGFMCALFSYSLWYPYVFAVNSGVPIMNLMENNDGNELRTYTSLDN